MKENIYGYVRVSTAEQNEERQMRILTEAGVKKQRLYVDKLSGKDFERPAYQRLLRKLRGGDVLYIVSIDRLGRNYEEVQKQWKHLTKDIGVDLEVMDMPLLNTTVKKDLMGTFIADLVLQILSFVAQNERENIRCRQAQGIDAARARGVHLGRPVKKLPMEFWEMAALWKAGGVKLERVLERFQISVSTFYRRMREQKRTE